MFETVIFFSFSVLILRRKYAINYNSNITCTTNFFLIIVKRNCFDSSENLQVEILKQYLFFFVENSHNTLRNFCKIPHFWNSKFCTSRMYRCFFNVKFCARQFSDLFFKTVALSSLNSRTSENIYSETVIFKNYNNIKILLTEHAIWWNPPIFLAQNFETQNFETVILWC